MFSDSWPLPLAFLPAFLAILTQQWIRNYTQRHNCPWKSSLRQYLYEGRKVWNVPRVAEPVRGCLYISLVLFYGTALSDSLFYVNTTVGISTIALVGIYSLLHILVNAVSIIYS